MESGCARLNCFEQVHIDQTPASGLRRVYRHAGEDAERLLRGRAQVRLFTVSLPLLRLTHSCSSSSTSGVLSEVQSSIDPSPLPILAPSTLRLTSFPRGFSTLLLRPRYVHPFRPLQHELIFHPPSRERRSKSRTTPRTDGITSPRWVPTKVRLQLAPLPSKFRADSSSICSAPPQVLGERRGFGEDSAYGDHGRRVCWAGRDSAPEYRDQGLGIPRA